MLRDRFGRTITNLRISITNRCNLNCFYCHREGQEDCKEEMSSERIAEIARAFYKLGVKKLKITGGEPLIRRDILDIISLLPPFKEVSLTTNGTYLSDLAYELREVGLDRVNVSLDTLNPEKYEFITGGGDVSRVIEGIKSACDADLTPVKINMVVMKGINENEVYDLLNFANSFNKFDVKAILQIIELMPIKGLKKYYFDISNFEREFESKAYAVKVRTMHKRKQYWTKDGVVEFVRPLGNTEFCMHCNRMRVTCDGKLKPCLLRNDTVDINGLHGEDLIEAIKEAVKLREPYFKERKVHYF